MVHLPWACMTFGTDGILNGNVSKETNKTNLQLVLVYLVCWNTMTPWVLAVIVFALVSLLDISVAFVSMSLSKHVLVQETSHIFFLMICTLFSLALVLFFSF